MYTSLRASLSPGPTGPAPHKAKGKPRPVWTESASALQSKVESVDVMYDGLGGLPEAPVARGGFVRSAVVVR